MEDPIASGAGSDLYNGAIARAGPSNTLRTISGVSVLLAIRPIAVIRSPAWNDIRSNILAGAEDRFNILMSHWELLATTL